jgi:hypothetical protein
MNMEFMEYLDTFDVVFIDDYWSTLMIKRDTKNISIRYCRSFKTMVYMSS